MKYKIFMLIALLLVFGFILIEIISHRYSEHIVSIAAEKVKGVIIP